MAQRSSYNNPSQFVYPCEVTKDEWAITRQSIQLEGLIVSHNLNLPSEIEVSRGFAIIC